jgi:hypothetical protein
VVDVGSAFPGERQTKKEAIGDLSTRAVTFFGRHGVYYGKTTQYDMREGIEEDFEQLANKLPHTNVVADPDQVRAIVGKHLEKCTPQAAASEREKAVSAFISSLRTSRWEGWDPSVADSNVDKFDLVRKPTLLSNPRVRLGLLAAGCVALGLLVCWAVAGAFSRPILAVSPGRIAMFLLGLLLALAIGFVLMHRWQFKMAVAGMLAVVLAALVVALLSGAYGWISRPRARDVNLATGPRVAAPPPVIGSQAPLMANELAREIRDMRSGLRDDLKSGLGSINQTLNSGMENLNKTLTEGVGNISKEVAKIPVPSTPTAAVVPVPAAQAPAPARKPQAAKPPAATRKPAQRPARNASPVRPVARPRPNQMVVTRAVKPGCSEVAKTSEVPQGGGITWDATGYVDVIRHRDGTLVVYDRNQCKVITQVGGKSSARPMLQ